MVRARSPKKSHRGNGVKICHITNEHSSDDPRIFHKMCTSLARSGVFDVFLVAPGESRLENGVHIIGAGERRMTEKNALPCRVWRKSFELLTLDKRLFLSRIYKKALAVDARIYHIHDIPLLPMGMKLKKRGYTVIFDSHEDYPAIASSGTLYLLKPHGILRALIANRLIMAIRPYRRLLNRLHHRLFRHYHDRCCRRFDAVVYVTPGRFFDFLLSLNPMTTLVTNYPLTQNTPPPDVCPDYASRKAVFAGGILPYWNHGTIIRAIADMPGATYILCGYTVKKYLRELMTLPGWEYVDYRGRVPHEEVAGILRSAAVGVAVYDYWANTEGNHGALGIIKIYEYMQAALPVVCTDFTLWKEMVAEYDCGICVNPDDKEGIKNAIRYLIDHPDEARRMGQNGRRAVMEKYNWAAEEARLLNLYGLLAARLG